MLVVVDGDETSNGTLNVNLERDGIKVERISIATHREAEVAKARRLHIYWLFAGLA